MSQAQKKNKKVPTFSELAGNVNKLKREVASLEPLLEEEREAATHLLVGLSKNNDRDYRLASKLALSIALNVALIGAVVIIIGVAYVR